MARKFLAWKESAAFSSISREEIAASFPSDATETGDGYRYETKLWWNLFDLEYQWTVELDREQRIYRVSEEAYLSNTWYYLFAASLVGSLFSNILTEFAAQWSQVFFGLFILQLFVFVFCIAALFGNQGPTTDLFSESDSLGRRIPVASPLLASLPFIPATLLSNGLLKIVWPVAVAGIYSSYWMFQDKAVMHSLRWQTWFTEKLDPVPLLAGNYILVLTSLAPLPLLFVIFSGRPEFLATFARDPWLTFLVPTVLFLFPLELMRRGLKQSRRYEEAEITSEGRNIEQVDTAVLSAVTVIGFSLGFAVLSYEFLRDATVFLDLFWSIPAAGLVLVASTPILYVGAGTLYQFTRFAVDIYVVVSNAEPLETDIEFKDDIQPVVIGSEGVFAGALHLGAWKYILVSQRLVDEFSDSELNAILMHEEAHLIRSDAFLSSAIAILSIFVFTGKNVLYAVFDFREREFQADRYAVEQTGEPDALVSAFERLQQLEAEENVTRLQSSIPTLTSFNPASQAKSLLESVFGLYYGDFAATEVHPDLATRKERFEDRTNEKNIR